MKTIEIIFRKTLKVPDSVQIINKEPYGPFLLIDNVLTIPDLGLDIVELDEKNQSMKQDFDLDLSEKLFDYTHSFEHEIIEIPKKKRAKKK